jgi:hypothetical protein
MDPNPPTGSAHVTKTAFAAAALLALSIPKITEELDELTPEQLIELRDLETTDGGQNRVTLIKLIDDKLEALAEPNADANAGPAAEPEKPAKRHAWQEPNYTGPLTGDQATWRLRQRAEFERLAATK